MTDKPVRRDHWDSAYTTKAPSEVSWFQSRPDASLDLIANISAGRPASLIDVGGGASTLVDHLLDAGQFSISVLDVADASLEHAKSRLRDRATHIEWIVADITKWSPSKLYDIWHDRAVLHFLTDPSDQAAYAEAMQSAVGSRGWAIIGGFAKGGPTRCSGLAIIHHDAESLQRLLGADFELRDARSETHRTPWGGEQLFAYHVFQRRGR